MPVWALCLSILLPVIYVLPSGFIYAMTGQAVRSRIIIIACFVTLSVLSFVGLAELACGNYPRDIAPWPTSCKHVF
jgi:hypothetical protein